MATTSHPACSDQCPGRDALAAYCAGKLPIDQLDTVAGHLATCRVCQTCLEELQTDADSLVEMLRGCIAQAAPEAFHDESVRTATQASPDTLPLSGQSAAGAASAESFGQYELLEKIGGGGMGVVHRARQIRLNRIVAIKLIKAGLHADAEERERFGVEAEAIARLQHPHVMLVHEFNEHEGRLYLCMEFLAGGTSSRAM